MQSSPPSYQSAITPEERVPSPPNTPATPAVKNQSPTPLDHLDTHLYQQKKRREFEADTGLQRMELRIDHDSGPQLRQGTEGKKHKKSGSTGGSGSGRSSVDGAYFNSRFFNHLSHYPVLTDAVSQVAAHAPQSIVSFIKTYSPNPPADGKNTLPLIGTLDTFGDGLLTTIDTYFPVLAKPTPELIDDTIKHVKKPVEGIWKVWAVPVVGTLTDPIVGRVNNVLVDIFKPQDIIRKAHKKQLKDEQAHNKQNSKPSHPHPTEKHPSGKPKTWAEVSVTPPPGGKQQLHKQPSQQNGHQDNQDQHFSTDDSDNHAAYKRKIKQQNEHQLQLERTYEIVTSILQDTQHAVRDPHTRIYKIPIVGGVVHKAASWAVGPDPRSHGKQGKKKGGNYPEKQQDAPVAPEEKGAFDGGETREKYENVGPAVAAENVTVIGGGREF